VPDRNRMAGVEKKNYYKLSEPEKRERLLAYANARSGGKKKSEASGGVRYSPFCGCCPVGVITYPTSIEDVLGTDCHAEFRDNFGMFLRMKKDKNTSSNWRNKLKFEQQVDFAMMTYRVGKGEEDPCTPYTLGEVGRRFYKEAAADGGSVWVKDLLEGFDKAQDLINHFKDLFRDSKQVLKRDLIVSAYRWVVDQVDKTLEEFKVFREGLQKEEREKWDKMVKEADTGIGCGEEEGITKEDWRMQKEMEDRVRLMIESFSPGSMVGSSGSGPILKSQCWYCHKKGGSLQTCSRCKNAVYCDEGCQRKDWRQHKGYCTRAKNKEDQNPNYRV